MPDIKLRDGSGVENTYEGVDTITLPLADGSGTWTFGLTDEELKLDKWTNQFLFYAKPNDKIWSKYIDRIDASEVYSIQNCFQHYEGDDLDKVEITFFGTDGGLYCTGAFDYSENITKLPKINNFVLVWGGMPSFQRCYSLENIQEFIETPNYGSSKWYRPQNTTVSDDSTFYFIPDVYGCYRLKTLDLKNIDRCIHNKSSYFYSLTSVPQTHSISYCSELNDISNIPVLSADVGFVLTSNFLREAFGGDHALMRLSHITFSLNEEDQPYKANWKSQTMNLGYSNNCGPRWETQGYTGVSAAYTEFYNIADSTSSSATLEGTQARYRAKKDAGEDDWVCYCGSKQVTYDGKSLYLSELFSRFNHDSAVELINSLPDTSEYLATAGGTNTIRFHGYSGALTDEGAINTMTPEEIQVATDKGWTVTFVD